MTRKALLVVLISLLMVSTGCSSAPAEGDRITDDSHAVRLESTQIIDEINGVEPAEGKVFLVIGYSVENLSGNKDTPRVWTDHMTLTSDDQTYEPITAASLDHQLRETALGPHDSASGYLAFSVPDEVADFKLLVTFPVSGKQETFEFRPADKRIGENAEFVLTRLEQIERTRNIPLIGNLLASLSSAPIRYLGTVLVPEDEIDQLLERTRGLDEEASQAAVEEYLLSHGHGRLD